MEGGRGDETSFPLQSQTMTQLTKIEKRGGDRLREGWGKRGSGRLGEDGGISAGSVCTIFKHRLLVNQISFERVTFHNFFKM